MSHTAVRDRIAKKNNCVNGSFRSLEGISCEMPRGRKAGDEAEWVSCDRSSHTQGHLCSPRSCMAQPQLCRSIQIMRQCTQKHLKVHTNKQCYSWNSRRGQNEYEVYRGHGPGSDSRGLHCRLGTCVAKPIPEAA